MRDIHTYVVLAYNESDDLEDCIKSLINQSVKSNIVIATSTKNDYIMDLASDYGLGVMVNEQESNKGNDYNFAINAFDTELVTIAHQDDLYDRNYTREILSCYKKNKDATIIFTDNYFIKKDMRVKHSKDLLRKHFLKKPLRYRFFQNKRYWKMRSLRYLNSICASSVTFVKKNIPEEIFPSDFIYNNDWQGFVYLARLDTKFVYLDKKLVGYRIYPKETNDEKILEDIRVYKGLWPDWLIDFIYRRRK